MKLAGYIKRYETHKAMMERMEANGTLGKLYGYDKARWSRLHRRLGFLEEAVRSRYRDYDVRSRS